MRYADHIVVVARYQGPALQSWIDEKIEKGPWLEINRDKTRVVDLREQKGSLDFLATFFAGIAISTGATADICTVGPSNKALQREWDRSAR